MNYKDVRKEESSVPAGGSFSEEGSRGMQRMREGEHATKGLAVF